MATFSLFLLKNQYLNVHYPTKEVAVTVKDSAGRLYKDVYPEDDVDEKSVYVVSPIPKKGNYYITITPKSQHQNLWQKIEFCAEDIDI